MRTNFKLSEKSHISDSEVRVLKTLSSRKPSCPVTASNPEPLFSKALLEVGEISFASGLRDNDEVLRALYTLEGKNLVSPHPEGDFTSDVWQITDGGLQALSILEASPLVA